MRFFLGWRGASMLLGRCEGVGRGVWGGGYGRGSGGKDGGLWDRKTDGNWIRDDGVVCGTR